MRYIVLAIFVLVGLLALPPPREAHAEATKSISETYSEQAYIETANLGGGASAEAVDLTGLTGFGSQPKFVRVCFENEDTTAGDGYLVAPVASGSVTASEQTTPADATLSTVIRIEDTTLGADARCLEFKGVGWIWQSEVNDVTFARAFIRW